MNSMKTHPKSHLRTSPPHRLAKFPGSDLKCKSNISAIVFIDDQFKIYRIKMHSKKPQANSSLVQDSELKPYYYCIVLSNLVFSTRLILFSQQFNMLSAQCDQIELVYCSQTRSKSLCISYDYFDLIKVGSEHNLLYTYSAFTFQ